MSENTRVVIFQAALEGLQSSMDAHGYAVNAADAWDFITNVWYESERPEWDLLTRALPGYRQGTDAFTIPMPAEFAADYARLVQEPVPVSGAASDNAFSRIGHIPANDGDRTLYSPRPQVIRAALIGICALGAIIWMQLRKRR